MRTSSARASEESVHIAVLEQIEVVFLRNHRHSEAHPHLHSCRRPRAGLLRRHRQGHPRLRAGSGHRYRLLTGLTRFTDQTIIDPSRLSVRIHQIGQRSYAINRGEWQPGRSWNRPRHLRRRVAHHCQVDRLVRTRKPVRTGAPKRFIPMVVEAASMIFSRVAKPHGIHALTAFIQRPCVPSA